MEDRAIESPGHSRRPRSWIATVWSPLTVRIACHVAVATPFLVACGLGMARGWGPQGDDAVIIFRSWAVLSSHPPLVGMYTHVTGTNLPVYDPGPMLFWFLTIPVHLDHLQGGLWGAALTCVLALSLAVEAAWSALRWRGSLAVVAVVLLMVAEFPALAIDPTWNAHMGLVWFITVAATAWAVATGHLRWWPVLVLAASFATQCHLMFALGSIACVVVAPLVGLIRVRKLGWWLPVGAVVGLACWIVPVIQELTNNPGNMTVIWRSLHTKQSTTGGAFGLQTLAASVGPHPIWWGRGEDPTANVGVLDPAIHSHPAWVGVVILVFLASCAALAFFARRLELAALALVTLLLSAAMVWTFASLPMSQFIFSFPYLDAGSWPVGMLVLLVLGWSVVELIVAGVGWARSWAGSGAGHRAGRTALTPGLGHLVVALVAVVFVVALVASSVGVSNDSANNDNPTSGWPVMSQVQRLTAAIERVVPRGRLLVLPPSGFTASYSAITGIDWLLYSDGWRPESSNGYVTLMGPQVAITRPLPPFTARVLYTVQGTGHVTITRTPAR